VPQADQQIADCMKSEIEEGRLLDRRHSTFGYEQVAKEYVRKRQRLIGLVADLFQKHEVRLDEFATARHALAEMKTMIRVTKAEDQRLRAEERHEKARLTEVLERELKRLAKLAGPPQPWEPRHWMPAQDKGEEECLHRRIRKERLKIERASLRRMMLSSQLIRLRRRRNLLRGRCSGLVEDLTYKTRMMNDIISTITNEETGDVSEQRDRRSARSPPL
jgi:hypothetical protein